MTQQAVPVLPAHDIQESILFYETKLGLLARNHGNCVTMENNGIRLHFFESTDKYLCQNSLCYIYVSNVKGLFMQLSGLDIIHPQGRLDDKGWGIKEFCVTDNNGNLLRFGKNANP